jgi:sulfoxide reductase heme-binding subunit YedZ
MKFKSKKALLLRHTLIGFLASLTVYLFWLSRPEWVFDMRLWRAFGDAGFVFLFTALVIGSLAKLWRPALRLVPWRREIGIWFALLAIIHSILILNGWAQWNVMKFFGYEFLPQFDRWARLEPGFGLANLIGLIALFWAIVLLATSSDRAVNFLGNSSWKRLQYGAYIIFYLVAIHIAYFMFIHYTVSFHRPVPDPNWFRYPFLGMALTLLVLQIITFIKTVIQQRAKS